MLHINQRDKKENAMQHLRILILTALMLSISFVSPAQAQRGPNSLDDCANNTNAFWSLTYQDTEELHDSNSVRVCAVVDGELGNIPRVDRISSNNDLISLSVELRTGYQVTFFSETNFGGERLVFTDSRTETNPFEVLSYIVEPLPEVVEPEVVEPEVLEPLDLVSIREVIAAGVSYTCALQANRRVVCWGGNEDGQASIPASVQGETVQIVTGEFSHLRSASQPQGCVLGQEFQWSNEYSRQCSGRTRCRLHQAMLTPAYCEPTTGLCAGDCNWYGQTNVPYRVQGETEQIGTNSFHTCALRADSTVVCWGGKNYFGQTRVPYSVQGEAVQIDVGYVHTCAVRADLRVVCWGSDWYGGGTIPDSVQGETVQITTRLSLHLRTAGRPQGCVLGIQ